jgi:hypothetical protein
MAAKRRLGDEFIEALGKHRKFGGEPISPRFGARFRAAMRSRPEQVPAPLRQNAIIARSVSVISCMSRGAHELFKMLGFRPYEKLLLKGNDIWQPGEPPHSTVLDSAFVAWQYYDAIAAGYSQPVAEMLAQICEHFAVEDEECRIQAQALREFAQSRYGVYRAETCLNANRTVLHEPFTGESLVVAHCETMRAKAGETYLWRLLPRLQADEDWCGLATPYILADFNSQEWLSYFQRVTSPDLASREAYLEAMKAVDDASRWLNFMKDGVCDGPPGKISLRGVPDLAGTKSAGDSGLPPELARAYAEWDAYRAQKGSEDWNFQDFLAIMAPHLITDDHLLQSILEAGKNYQPEHERKASKRFSRLGRGRLH